MSDVPAASERIRLSDAVVLLSPGDHAAARMTIKSRASRGLISSWVESYEEVAPKGYDELIEAAEARALAKAEGDQIRAAIMMQGWQIPDDADWEVVRESDVLIPKKFWAAIADNDGAWTANAFLGRRASFDGYEQNWVGIYLRRSDVEALPRIGGPTLSVASDADGVDQPLVVPGAAATPLPSQADLTAWAREFHAAARAAGRSVDWRRAGQEDLERAFPGHAFKRTDALDLAKSLGLTRTYSR